MRARRPRSLAPIGAPANVVVAGVGERAGQEISFFLKFMLYVIPVTLACPALATAYVVVRYYWPPAGQASARVNQPSAERAFSRVRRVVPTGAGGMLP